MRNSTYSESRLTPHSPAMDFSDTAHGREALDEEAIAWFVRLRDEGTTHEEIVAWKSWMKEDPRHVRAWQETLQLWQGLEPGHISRGTPLSTNRRRWQARKLLLSAAAILILLTGTTCISLLHHPGGLGCLTASHCTSAGETRQVQLEDGSLVTLGAASALRVHYDSGKRLVHLRHGEAYFDVQHDPLRPFEVQASQGSVRVVGTSFNLRLKPQGAQVSVASGKVELSTHGQQLELTTGQSAQYTGAHLSRLPESDPATIGLWRQERLLFQSTPLGEVLRDLDRYHPARILVDPAVASMPVSGIFSTRNPEAALETIINSLALRETRFGNLIIRIAPAG
ncbi:FecR protein [Desulfurispirillum indicum S5]|uniref:FecR protein n=1 Tax=Desulfurispirillum indicum (strain ATCC BAA-1389 / DSM 22839 / S5) TaxID=653733 RepID=E6W1A5_DESIS|nr:FecR family protein [Desulfurispirillum indicum]ADU66525.1 FecR protein [Desulfurispirillum indicum S5]